MTTLQHGLYEALNLAMLKADEALDRNDYEAHQTWTEWSEDLLAAIKRYQQQQ